MIKKQSDVLTLFIHFFIKRENQKLFIMKTKFLLFGASVALFLFISCNSNEKIQSATAVSSTDVAVVSKIDASVNDVAAIAEDQFAIQQSLTNKSSVAIKSILPTCATITTVLANGTWTRTIDFGTAGCALPNGNLLKGKIIISFANDFTSLTRTISYSFEGFYHNGKLLQGSRTIVQTLKSTDLLATIHPVSTFTIDMSVTFADGKVYTRTGIRVREMVAGFDTPSIWEDNVFLETGNGSTTLPNGDIITSTITTPLRFAMSCNLPFPVLGVISITKNDSAGVLDFGNGDCDNLATITVNGVTKEISLEK